jgi:hypothetical protein
MAVVAVAADDQTIAVMFMHPTRSSGRLGGTGENPDGGPCRRHSREKARQYQTLIPNSQLAVVRSDAYHIAAANADECVANVLSRAAARRRVDGIIIIILVGAPSSAI